MSMVRLRIINLKQFPLPGSRVWRDTLIARSGRNATLSLIFHSHDLKVPASP